MYCDRFGAVAALYHVDDVFGVTVDVMTDRSGFACRVSVRYVFTSETVFFRMGMSPGAGCVVWDCEVWP